VDIVQLTAILKSNGDKVKAQKISAYLLNQFVHFGIPMPKLRSLVKPLLKTDVDDIDWKFVFECFDADQREMQYTAIYYLSLNYKNLNAQDLDKIKQLILTKSWWDTVDSIYKFVGHIVAKGGLKDTMIDWSCDDNLWIRRTAIMHQIYYKQMTDIQVLQTVIKNNFGSKEFFINKAIGWILREYSKINPIWVKQFIIDNGDKLSRLSIREGSKRLKI